MAADLDNSWEVLAEPIQTVMRRWGAGGAGLGWGVGLTGWRRGWDDVDDIRCWQTKRWHSGNHSASLPCTHHSYCPPFPSPPCPPLRQIVCRYAVPEPYEKLKAFTRGNKVTQASMQEFVGGIEGIPEGAKAELLALTPATYIGNAAQQAKNIRRRLAEL